MSSERSRKKVDTKMGKFCVFEELQGSWSRDMERRIRNKIREVKVGCGSHGAIVRNLN